MQRPDGTATMSGDDEVREVAGSEESLLVLIDRGEVPTPALMTFNGWQKWRRDVGRRPTVRKDGIGTTPKVEAGLWRSNMNHVHGSDWLEELYGSEDDGEEEEMEEDPKVGGELVVLARPAGELLHPGSAAPRAPSPGSGVVTPPARGAGSGSRSLPGTPSSWRSNDPGTPGGLSRLITRSFDPEKESLQYFENRLRRQALALETIGEPMPAASIDMLLVKARLMSEAPSDREDRLKLLKREYAIGLLEDDVANIEDTAIRSRALEELLTEMGFDPTEVRGRILRGEPVATPTPQKTMRSAPAGSASQFG